MARRPARERSRSRGGAAARGGVALICLAAAGLGSLAYFYFSVPDKPKLDPVSLCPVAGPRGITVVLVDTSDDLPEIAQREVLGILDDQITSLPAYHKLDIRVLDVARSRSRSLFAKCNPGDGNGLSEWTSNPALARARWIESFRQPASEAVKHSVVAAQANTSPIMAALQDIAVDDFSGAAAERIGKSLIIVSDMLENTRDYNQYRNLSDLSYQRFKQSQAYLKYRTDLHGARVTIEYIQRVLPTGLDTVRHIEFWKDWVTDNRGTFEIARRLQGAG
ncbi:MAG: hypothetical protein ACLP1D_24385 [Xanthobacteraceae bacterium]